VPNTNPLVAIDNGYDWTKVVTRDRQLCLPTSVTRSSHVIARAIDGPRVVSDRRYKINGTVYTVGAEVPNPIDTRNDEFPYSDANLAVVVEALRRALPEGTEQVHVVTNLPVNRFYVSTGERREFDLARKAAAWRRTIRDMSGAALPRIDAFTAISEAVAAWCDYVIGPDLRLNNQRFGALTAIVDIGGRTTDIALVKEGDIHLQQSGTRDIGTLNLAAVVRRRVEDHCPSIDPRSHSSIETAIRQGTIRVGNREIDVRDALEREKTNLLELIENFVVSRFGQIRADIQHILFVGGGSALLEPYLRVRFPEAEFAPEPQMANARGLYKSECYLPEEA
jgi:plasmid segregation protein ParM